MEMQLQTIKDTSYGIERECKAKAKTPRNGDAENPKKRVKTAGGIESTNPLCKKITTYS